MALMVLFFYALIAAAFFGILFLVIRAGVAAGLRLDRERRESFVGLNPARLDEDGR